MVFLKEPRAGFVKTRLAGEIGERAALDLYRAFVRDQLAWLARFPSGARWLCFTPGRGLRACLGLLPRGRRDSFVAVRQGRGDLGSRLRAAFAAAFRDRFETVVAVGADAPLLSPDILRDALRALRRKDLVIGPSRDGGYYLIGLRRHTPRLFRGIPWSTGGVLQATRARAREGCLGVALLPMLGDVDTAADLPALEHDLEEARVEGGYFPVLTARALRAWRRSVLSASSTPAIHKPPRRPD